MAQPLLSPLPSVATFKHVQQQRHGKVHSSSSTVRGPRPTSSRSPWQTMLEQSCSSLPSPLNTSGRELPLFHLYSLRFNSEQEQRMRQQQEFYLNYGRALRILREDIPRWEAAARPCERVGGLFDKDTSQDGQ